MTKDLEPKDVATPDFSLLFLPVEDESRLLIGCRWTDYSASLISRAVEDCNARVLNLIVTAVASDLYDVVVALRVNHRNPEAVARSLSRYGYEVIEARGSAEADTDTDSMRSRVDQLIRLLEI